MLVRVIEAIAQAEREIWCQRMQLQRGRREGCADPLGEALLVVLDECLTEARRRKAALEAGHDRLYLCQWTERTDSGPVDIICEP